MEKLGINLTLLIAQIVNIAVLILLLRSVAYKPILKFLDGRREKIAKGLEDARKAEARLANIEADYSKRMDEARSEGQKTVAEMTANAEKQAAAIIAKANEDATRSRVQAQEEAMLERNKALADLRTQVVALSMAAANKLIGESMGRCSPAGVGRRVLQWREVGQGRIAGSRRQRCRCEGESLRRCRCLPMSKRRSRQT